MIAGLNSAVRGLLIGVLYLKMGQSVVIQVPGNHRLREGGFCGEYHVVQRLPVGGTCCHSSNVIICKI